MGAASSRPTNPTIPHIGIAILLNTKFSKGQMCAGHLPLYWRSQPFCFAVARIFVGCVRVRQHGRASAESLDTRHSLYPPPRPPRRKKFRSAASPPLARTPPAPFLPPPSQGGAGSPLRIPHPLRGDEGRWTGDVGAFWRMLRFASAFPLSGMGLALIPLLRVLDRKFPPYYLLSLLRFTPAFLRRSPLHYTGIGRRCQRKGAGRVWMQKTERNFFRSVHCP